MFFTIVTSLYSRHSLVQFTNPWQAHDYSPIQAITQPFSNPSMFEDCFLNADPIVQLILFRSVLSLRQIHRPSTSDDDMESQKPFRLLDLPVELRAIVYEQAFAKSKVLLIENRPYPAPALLLTSQRLYLESIKIFYQVITFTSNFCSTCRCLQAFRQSCKMP